MNIAVVTDSTADIPADLSARHNIHVVPNMIVIGGRSFEDGKGISREEFYNRLPQMKETPTTGTASSGVYTTLYSRLLQGGADCILSVHAAASLSGILNAVHTAAREFGDRVLVEDSGSVSMGLGFQVLAAAEAISRMLSMTEVLAVVRDVRRRIRVLAMLDTLEYVRRSGRVSWAKARLGNLLQVKPFIEVGEAGKVNSLGEARTRNKGIARLKEIILGFGELERLAVLHTNGEVEARRLLSELNPIISDQPLIINITSVIGTHVGPNCLGCAAVVK